MIISVRCIKFSGKAVSRIKFSNFIFRERNAEKLSPGTRRDGQQIKSDFYRWRRSFRKFGKLSVSSLPGTTWTEIIVNRLASGDGKFPHPKAKNFPLPKPENKKKNFLLFRRGSFNRKSVISRLSTQNQSNCLRHPGLGFPPIRDFRVSRRPAEFPPALRRSRRRGGTLPKICHSPGYVIGNAARGGEIDCDNILRRN